eukprot:CAMPEP_0182851196 /NCGR_PEP_ID=MMETSP0006_2-20121128/30503_1 /TAXON_ID=97485 /ORGANISM="Prymnesium parvum, Strain Texoma1" /LENGTH=66 /DNA_ID=CAMNT_0024981861 /DNA_START=802 /DNA_END=999 /DNA_ORIENTATION=+
MCDGVLRYGDEREPRAQDAEPDELAVHRHGRQPDVVNLGDLATQAVVDYPRRLLVVRIESGEQQWL